MTMAELVGAVGVALLLVAFVLNARGKLDSAGRAYHGLNAVGAGAACWASWAIGYAPFVVLEGAWTAVAVAGLARPSLFAPSNQHPDSTQTPRAHVTGA